MTTQTKERLSLASRALARLEIHGEWAYHSALKEAAKAHALAQVGAALGASNGVDTGAALAAALKDAGMTLRTNCILAIEEDFALADEIQEAVES